MVQDDTVVQFEPIRPRRLSPALKAVMILNLPALLLAIPIAAALSHGNELGTLYIATAFIPALWFWVVVGSIFNSGIACSTCRPTL